MHIYNSVKLSELAQGKAEREKKASCAWVRVVQFFDFFETRGKKDCRKVEVA